MIVLGIGGFLHDYNCCLVDVTGRRVALREAERESRRKHHVITDDEDLLVPIRDCCDELRLRPRDITTVAFAHTDAFEARGRLRDLLPGCAFVDVDHHLSHAAAGFFSAPYDQAAVVSLDGFGDGASGLLLAGRGTHLEPITRISDDDSIGLEYLRATLHLGLGGFGSEGKTQGLAAYGEPTVFDDYMNEIEILSDGNLRLSPRLRSEGSFLAEQGGYLDSLVLNNAFLNGYAPRRIAPEPLTDLHRNLAASIQKVLEHVAIQLCRITKERTGSKNLVLSGGVFMNSSVNGELLRSSAFERVFALPMASDRGTGLGAALYHVHHTLGVPRFFRLESVFYGESFSDRQAVKAMKRAGLKITRTDEVADVAARALREEKIVGWFQGRSEMGARALGHRSILANPGRAEMKDVVNRRVKHRETFRPFAPAVPEHLAGRYFTFPEDVADLGFMTFTVEATGQARQAAPAVVHGDGTGRIQTVRRERDGLYADVVERFGDLTGHPVILNTSFNDKNEPIVESPADAVAMFLESDMDVLCVGNVVGVKG